MNHYSFKLPIDHIEKFRKLISDNTDLMLNNGLYNKAWNSLCACSSRVEDIVRYLNSRNFGEERENGCAFDIMELLLHSSTLINCIDVIIGLFGIEDSVSSVRIFFKKKDITNFELLNKRLAEINPPYKNEDDLYFEYIRSIGVAHPTETNRHPYFQRYKKETSPFMVWNPLPGLTEGDIVLHVYDLGSKKDIVSLRLWSKEIFDYVSDRYSRIALLNEELEHQIKRLITRLKTEKILSENSFDSYGNYLTYLKGEAHKRCEYLEHYIDDVVKLLGVDAVPEEISLDYLKYCNALKYAIEDLRILMQGSLLDDSSNDPALMVKLRLPRLLDDDMLGNENYFYEKTGQLFNQDQYSSQDICWARIQARALFKRVESYSKIKEESLDFLNNVQLLAVLNTALYFYSLDHDTYINKRIPKTKNYR